jgi:hypothetical protein
LQSSRSKRLQSSWRARCNGQNLEGGAHARGVCSRHARSGCTPLVEGTLQRPKRGGRRARSRRLVLSRSRRLQSSWRAHCNSQNVEARTLEAFAVVTLEAFAVVTLEAFDDQNVEGGTRSRRLQSSRSRQCGWLCLCPRRRSLPRRPRGKKQNTTRCGSIQVQQGRRKARCNAKQANECKIACLCQVS